MELNIDKTGWKSYRFDEFAQNISQRVEPKQTDLEIYVGLEHLDPDNLHIKRNGTPADVEGTKLKFYKGDVIFGKRRAYQRKAALAETDGICSAHAMVLRANTKLIDERLFPFFFHSKVFQDIAVKISVGGLSPTINWKDLAKQEFLLPPKDQQARLAELLWVADEVVEREREVKEKLENYKRSLLNSILCGDFFENRNIELPKLTPISKLCSILNGYAFQSDNYISQGIRVIRITNVQKGYIDDSDPAFYPEETISEIKKYMLLENDILVSLTGNVGRVGLINKDLLPAALNQRVCCLRILNKDVLNEKYFYFILNSDLFEQESIIHSSGSAQKNMSTEWLKTYKVPVPTITTQNLLTDEFDKMDVALQNSLKEVNYSRILNKGLINEIF